MSLRAILSRIRTIGGYLFRSLALSLTGLIFVLAMLAFWAIFFDPSQGTPETGYYFLMTTLFGAAITFLATLAFATRANRALNYPLLARLPSRVEYLAAVFFAAVLYASLLQLTLGVLALWRGPAFTPAQFLEIPPVWLSINILAAVMALHASDLVVREWSRVYVYGITALLLFINSLTLSNASWFTDWANRLSAWFFVRGIAVLGDLFNNLANWSATTGAGLNFSPVAAIFWPFRALSEAAINGAFTPVQALAPGVLLLYATLLFMLAAEFFAIKDLFLTE